ncbi:hypothetical protein G6O69_32380 [Pseudenhygromyxa sp. WMMC2535]|uniref:hypothetical protein n=1 Tax=Pseudenhygromyxa sp. WMMC2535 TaxID=2712867 RepID=UPI00155329A6|nr:hypothetical protein [Pseudenhygromyxa sp. WMMC2535]NVB42566.1 hypothetical protein [Pseudenhygromyxa sp. WMMC2535]
MKPSLDRALAEIIGPMEGLRAVVLSIAPDGLIAWSWERNAKHDIALGFAALNRAASTCFESLGASQRDRSVLLNAKNSCVAVWPLEELAETDTLENGRMTLTVVFSGRMQSGMVMLYGNRIRLHLRQALAAARCDELSALRSELVELLEGSEEPDALLAKLSQDGGVELRRLARLEALSERERTHLHEAMTLRRAARRRLHH